MANVKSDFDERLEQSVEYEMASNRYFKAYAKLSKATAA